MRRSSSVRARFVVVVSLTFALLAAPVSPYSMGAPPAACADGIPRHGPPPQKSQSPFRISVSADNVESGSGDAISVRLSAPDSQSPFIGFLLQARNSSGDILSGRFRKENAKDDVSMLLNCDALENAVTHKNKREKEQVSLLWEPSAGSSGEVTFRATFVKSKETFWVGVESPKVVVKRAAIPPISNPNPAPPSGGDTTPPQREGGRSNPTLGFPPGLDTSRTPQPTTPVTKTRRPAVSSFSNSNENGIYDGCAERKGCFGDPEGCLKSKDCKKVVAYTAVETGDGGHLYRFELQGESPDLADKDAYIALGFSNDEYMGGDAVISCSTGRGGIKIVRGFNVVDGKTNRKLPAEQQAGLSNARGSVKDLTISCSFDLLPQFTHTYDNKSVVFDLESQEYFLFMAAGYQKNESQIGYHTSGHAKTSAKSSLSAVKIQAGDSLLFVRLHGSFMFGAWIGSASLGMLFARYYKTTWTNSQCFKKDLWFRFHQTFMVTTWGLTMAAFVLIFLELKGWSSVKITTNPHAVLGCVTTGLCFMQPIGALFRCAPDAKKRPIFNWLHWLGGNAAQIIGIVAMFFAVDLQKARLPKKTTNWILVAFVAFHGLVHFILSIVQCVSENKQRENRADVYPMKDMGVGQSYYYPTTKQDAPGGGLRKFMLALYFLVNAAFTTVLILMVIFAPIEKTLEEWGIPLLS